MYRPKKINVLDGDPTLNTDDFRDLSNNNILLYGRIPYPNSNWGRSNHMTQNKESY